MQFSSLISPIQLILFFARLSDQKESQVSRRRSSRLKVLNKNRKLPSSIDDVQCDGGLSNDSGSIKSRSKHDKLSGNTSRSLKGKASSKTTLQDYIDPETIKGESFPKFKFISNNIDLIKA